MKKYVILSLKHSTPGQAIFWRANDAGYTSNPWAAGIYTEEQVKAEERYYNDGSASRAIPLTQEALDSAGFNCIVDLDFLKKGGQL